MISKKEALTLLLSLAKRMPVESIAINNCFERVLANSLEAKCTHPPTDVSAMDGYAMNKLDKKAGRVLKIIGESAAGKSFPNALKRGETLRIFTGASLPAGSNCVVIQEDVTRENEKVTLNKNIDQNDFVRSKGFDFVQGFKVKAPVRLKPATISLLAAMNYSEIPVFKKPNVALIATGNELISPGGLIGPDKIVSSIPYGLSAMLQSFGAVPTIFPIAKDDFTDIKNKLSDAKTYDLILTIGGVSAGNYDLVKRAAQEIGLKIKFHMVAMKPGKPLLAGELASCPLIGLPGNPVSAMVCSQLMVKPLINKMLGIDSEFSTKVQARLTKPLPKNGAREQFIRGTISISKNELMVSPLDRQDSSLLSELRKADVLIVRPQNDPSLSTNELVDIITFFPEFI